jgi:hypothetical protein
MTQPSRLPFFPERGRALSWGRDGKLSAIKNNGFVTKALRWKSLQRIGVF